MADYSPAFAPDGTIDRLHGADRRATTSCSSSTSATGAKKQLTFGSHDDTGAKFYDDHTIVFTSTATDPACRCRSEVARNGNIPNVWTLDLQTNELRQWTDTATGNVSPVVLKQPGSACASAFMSYYKGENGIHAIAGEKPIATVAPRTSAGRARCSSSRRRSATRCCATTSARRAPSRR